MGDVLESGASPFPICGPFRLQLRIDMLFAQPVKDAVEYDPYAEIAFRVIERAVRDLTYPGRNIWSIRHRDDAHSFLTTENFDLDFWCGVAGLDAPAIRTAVRRRFPGFDARVPPTIVNTNTVSKITDTKRSNHVTG